MSFKTDTKVVNTGQKTHNPISRLVESIRATKSGTPFAATAE